MLDRQTGGRNFMMRHAVSVPAETVHRVLDQLDSDYQEFRYYFNLSVPGRTPVYLHRNQTSLINSSFVHPFETGTVYNEEIHLAPLSHIRNNATLSSVITQQVVRLILYSRRMNGCPRWLYEGAAAYFAGLHRLQSPPLHIPVAQPSDLNELLQHPHTEEEFHKGIYFSALSFKSILERYGEAHTVTLYRLFNGEFEYEEAVPYSLGVTIERFERQWRIDIERLYSELRESRGN